MLNWDILTRTDFHPLDVWWICKNELFNKEMIAVPWISSLSTYPGMKELSDRVWKIGICFTHDDRSNNPDSTITPVFFGSQQQFEITSGTICDVDTMGFSTLQVEDMEATFQGPDKSISIKMEKVERCVLSGNVLDNLIVSKEDIKQHRKRQELAYVFVITEILSCNNLSIGVKIGCEETVTEIKNRKIPVGFKLKKFMVDKDGVLHETPEEPQMWDIKFGCLLVWLSLALL